MLIFVSLAFAGFLMVAGSFLFGGEDHDHDHDIDHDHDLDHGAEGNEHSISIFSTKVLFTFVMGFGAAGAIAMHFGLNTFYASLVGVGAGFVLGMLMYLLMNFFIHQQGNSVLEVGKLVGLFGTVTVSIEQGSMGQVGLTTVHGYHNFAARSENEIAKGRRVKVLSSEGGIVNVVEA